MKEEKKEKKLVRLVKAKSNFEISHSVASQYSGSAWGRLPSQFSDGDRNHSVWFTDFLVIRSHTVDAYLVTSTSKHNFSKLLVSSQRSNPNS